MKIELLDMLSKVAGIGGACLGVYFFIASKTLKRKFLNIFPVDTAAKMVVFTITLTWSVAVFGVFVWVNSDMRSIKQLYGDKIDFMPETTTTVVSRSVGQAGTSLNSGHTKPPEAEAKVDQRQGTYKSTNVVSTVTRIESKKKENEKEASERQKVLSIAASIPISILNPIFTLIFCVFLFWVIFIASSFFYNSRYMTSENE